MREIKFRAWTEFKTMVNVSTINFATSEAIMPDGEWYKVKLMQYTGLTDRNGKEIYEGDIVATPNWGGAKNKIISYSTEAGAFLACDSFIEPLGYSMGNGRVEVIGNIYENKELLK